jgi:sec-independent protein translocase protein TatA
VFGNLGGGEILLILVFVLIFFGPKKIPEIAQGLGKGIREFKKGSQSGQGSRRNQGSQRSQANRRKRE